MNCNGEIGGYSNTEGQTILHSYDANGFCTLCDAYEPAVLTTDKYDVNGDKVMDEVYEIDNAGKLYWFAAVVNGGYGDVAQNTSANAVLTENIKVNQNLLSSLTYDGAGAVTNGDSFRAWIPIGTDADRYIGTFDGNNKTVSDLYFNNSTDYVGLFGYVGSGGTVKNVGVVDSYLSGESVGGIVGLNRGTVESCYNSGTVTCVDYSYVGGVVGINYGTIKNCYNTGAASGNNSAVGGVVGWNYSAVENCYNTGSISDGYCVGGVVGLNYVTVQNCYFNTDIYNGNAIGINDGGTVDELTGGKTAAQFASGEVAYLLQAGQTAGEDGKTPQVWYQTIGTDPSPKFTGSIVYAVVNCNGEIGGYSNTEGQTILHSYDANGFCTACGGYQPAVDSDNDGYYEIDNAGKLYWFAAVVNGGYGDVAQNTSANAVLTENITVNKNLLSSLTYDGDGNVTNGDSFRVWTPIGNSTNRYTGTFDGNNKTVSGLYFNNSTDYVGLFGYVGSGGTVKNVGVIDSYLNGNNSYVGGVVGWNNDTVTNCYNTGTVSGSSYVGGVVGWNNGTVTNCYNTGTVSGSSSVGGLVGENDDGKVQSCYNSGAVSGSNYVGGVVGFDYSGTVTNCYFNTDTYNGIAIGFDTGTVDALAGGKTAAQFASGEVAYLLQAGQDGKTPQVWGQDLDNGKTVQTIPGFTGATVYTATNCKGEISGYSNTEGKTIHSYDANGFCTVCGGYQPATLTTDKYDVDGDEVMDEVYEIDNAGKLYWFSQQVNIGNNDINAVLTENITVNKNLLSSLTYDGDGNVTNGDSFLVWIPIATGENYYTGTFDGNNKTVSGLYFNDSAAKEVGLFGYVGSGGKVQNVGVVDSYLSGGESVGGVVGFMYSGTVQNCYNSGTVTGGNSSYVGGVVGWKAGTVESCYNTGTVTGGPYATVGGMVGENCGTVQNCYFNTDTYTGNAIGINDGGTVDELTGGKTAAQFASGEVAYLLGNGWGQTIDTNALPVVGGAIVYKNRTGGCTEAAYTYEFSNTQKDAVTTHAWNEGEVTTDPTCSAVGTKIFTCTHNSEHTKTEEVAIDENAHAWNEGEVTTDPTCSAVGTKIFTCTHNSEHTKIEEVAIDENAHAWNEGEVTTDPTCSAVGTKTFTCTHNSAHTYTEDVAIDENAHAWNSGVVTTNPTCMEKGVKTYTCTHNSAHTYTEEVAIDENAHTWNDGVVMTDPTCTEKGVKTFTCIYDNQHTKTEDVNALGHAYDNACDATCNTCGEERTPSDHVDADENDTCDGCGAEIPKDELSGGAIAGIVTGSFTVLGGGGFALFWFVIRKKRRI